MSLDQILAKEKPYRFKQIAKAWFDVNVNGYDEVTSLPIELRSKLKDLPWLCLTQKTLLQSKVDNTRKILFELVDKNLIETVVMGREDRYTICISSQAGCAMGCVFCATGKAGFKRNLTMEEIIDQIRFCQRLLAQESARISNIVIMGQGEPLLNYENVKRALNIILGNTNIGPTKITLSTCGIPLVMEKLLTDKDFPSIRMAVSLHSAIEETRKKIMPSHQPGFLDFLIKWAKEYHKNFGTKTHFIGLEYIMLNGINDDEKHLKALIKLAKKLPHIRINLIPFNTGGATSLNRASQSTIERFHDSLMQAGFVSTIRYSQGQDISAACGQLRNTATA